MAGTRDRWLAGGLIALLITLTVLAAARQSQEEMPPPYTANSSEPHGIRALLLWLSDLGYRTDARPSAAFRIPSEATTALVLEPSLGFTAAEWQIMDRWVEQGGTLILAGSGFASSTAFPHFGFRLASLSELGDLSAQVPLLRSPPLTEPPLAQARVFLSPGQESYLPILAAGQRPVMVELERGAGRVLLSSTAYPFSNEGLKEPGNAALVLSLISSADGSGSVWFDEWHHGIRSAQRSIVGPGNWLRYTPAGQSVAYAAAVVFVALALRGRRFGRPEPLPEQVSRRGPFEHVTAIANLGRLARHRQAVLGQYRHELKRSLGWRFRLDPSLPDEDYVRLLSLLDPHVDADQLGALLEQLGRSDVSERELVELAAAAARWSG